MTNILWGGHAHYKKIIKKYNVQFDGYVKKSLADDVVLPCRPVKKSELTQLDNPRIIIGYGKEEMCLKTVAFCRENGIQYTLLDLFVGKKLTGQMIKNLGGSFTDENNNTVIIDNHCKLDGPIQIIFKKNTKNAHIEIEKIRVTRKLLFNIQGRNAVVKIHRGSSFNDVRIRCCTDGKIEIGENCMFSHDVELSQSDKHLIFDMNTHERINWGKDINIGNHVWVGRSVHLLGGANIGSGSVVGDSCVTSSTFGSNCIIAGNSGRVIRENIIWARDLIRVNNAKTLAECKDRHGLDGLE